MASKLMTFGSSFVFISEEDTNGFIPTNCFNSNLADMFSSSNAITITGDPLYCSSCRAIFNHKSLVINHNQWVCEFCQTLNNDVKLNEGELPSSDFSEFILSPPTISNETPVTSNDKNSALILFIIDTSGSMSTSTKVGNSYFTRLDCVKKAVLSQLDFMEKHQPDKRVAVITFSNEVTIHGSETTRFSDRNLLNNYGSLLEAGLTTVIDEPITKSKNRIVDQLNSLRENGYTALGPAIVLAAALASRHPGSKCVLCTDGLANAGVGTLTNDHTKNLDFYGQVAHYAKRQGVVFNVITIQSTKTKLEYLGLLADITAGQVDIVDPTNLDFGNISKTTFLASLVEVTVLCHRSFALLDISVPTDKQANTTDAPRKNKYCKVINVGNLTSDSEIAVEFEKEPGNSSSIERVIQLQLLFTKLDGSRILRVLTRECPTNKNYDQILQNIDIGVVCANVGQQCSRLVQAGRYEEARERVVKADDTLARVIRTPEQRELYDNFLEMNRKVMKQLDLACQKEKESGVQFDEMNSEEQLVWRATNRNDELAQFTYQTKSSGAEKCLVQ